MIATRTRSKFSFQKSKRCFVLAFVTAVCWILIQSNAAVLGADAAAAASDVKSPGTINQEASDYANLGVIDLTSKNFGTTVGFGDGNVWLIEFYTPTCSHCVSFAPTYQDIARAIHSSTPDEKIRVARINCSEEKALMTRFGVKAFPSFFLVAGWDVYEFEGSRSATTLVDYARGGYKKKKVRTASINKQTKNNIQNFVACVAIGFGI
jgi:thioredoxin-like negative regulator of GroEL